MADVIASVTDSCTGHGFRGHTPVCSELTNKAYTTLIISTPIAIAKSLYVVLFKLFFSFLTFSSLYQKKTLRGKSYKYNHFGWASGCVSGQSAIYYKLRQHFPTT